MSPHTITISDPNGNVVFQGFANPKEFSTGSRGLALNGGKAEISGKKHTVNINIIEVGSKPKKAENK